MGIAFDFPFFRVKVSVGVWNPVSVNSPRYTRSFPFSSSVATHSSVTVIKGNNLIIYVHYILVGGNTGKEEKGQYHQ
jgi:hypothetical protein